jgi:hypothetical protein
LLVYHDMRDGMGGEHRKVSDCKRAMSRRM